jgi:formate/nitrite transporter FocA (FNT family)
VEKLLVFFKQITKTPKLAPIVFKGIMAGLVIGLAAAASVSCSYDLTGGIKKLVSAGVFALGLGIIVVAEYDLGTGVCMKFVNVLERKVDALSFFVALLFVFFCNFFGVSLATILAYTAMPQDAFFEAIRIGVSKQETPLLSAFLSAIGCNIAVCLGALLASKSNSVFSKFIGAFAPVFFFVAIGFEHVVANVFYWMFSTLGYSFDHKVVLMVFLGNIVGGLFVATATFFVKQDVN